MFACPCLLVGREDMHAEVRTRAKFSRYDNVVIFLAFFGFHDITTFPLRSQGNGCESERIISNRNGFLEEDRRGAQKKGDAER